MEPKGRFLATMFLRGGGFHGKGGRASVEGGADWRCFPASAMLEFLPDDSTLTQPCHLSGGNDSLVSRGKHPIPKPLNMWGEHS